GARGGVVTAGARAGVILQAAACIAGDDPAKITRLPDTRGMRNEIVMQRAHRFAYDQAYRVAGGVLVEIGLARRTQPFELETAIDERTAAVAYLVSPFTSPPGVLTLEQVIALAHARGVPVIVDAASMLPPRENLTKFLRLGADLVSFSGGKGIRGPQSTGIVAGRRDLVRAVALNASPNQALGRAAKTSKEEICGLVVAPFSVTTFISTGIRHAVGPFLKPIVADLHLDRASFSLVIALSLFLYGLFMPVAGMLLDRFSVRVVSALGTLLLVASLVMTA